jgi:hypothetical protein
MLHAVVKEGRDAFGDVVLCVEEAGIVEPRSRLSMRIGQIKDGVANVTNILLFRNLIPVRPSSHKSIPNCSIQEARVVTEPTKL